MTAWLRNILAENEALALDDARDRERLIEAVIAGLPRVPIRDAVVGAIGKVLADRAIADRGDELAHQLSKETARAVLTVLGFEEPTTSISDPSAHP